MCALLCCFNGQRKVDLMVARDQRQRRWSLDNTSSSQFALRSCLCHPLFTLAGSHFQDTMQAAARQVDDKECYSSYTTNGGGGAAINGRRKNPPGPSSRGPKPMPSKWDDAQKWLVGSAAANNAAKPRNSNADDRRLLSSSCSQNGRISCSSMDGALEYNMVVAPPTPPQLGEDDGETKNMDEVVRASVCLRDMGTEMTPIASKEPSRAATPLRASTPVDARSPVSSRSSTPARAKPWQQQDLPLAATVVRTPEPLHGGEAESHVPSRNSLESRAAAWDEAERAKFTARYKREEVKIQAWENHEKRKAEMEMKKIEMKAEQMKARAQERLANKLAAARRVAEEKRASAEAMLNEGAARTSEKADYIRRTGHLPSSFFSFSFRIPSLCG